MAIHVTDLALQSVHVGAHRHILKQLEAPQVPVRQQTGPPDVDIIDIVGIVDIVDIVDTALYPRTCLPPS